MSIDVGAVEDFADRQVSILDIGQRQIGVIRWSGDFYAISNFCTHQGGPLCHGVLSPRLAAAQPGELELDTAAPLLACPWHGWEFDVRTGRAILDPKVRARTFPVRVEDGRVLIEIGGRMPSDQT